MNLRIIINFAKKKLLATTKKNGTTKKNLLPVRAGESLSPDVCSSRERKTKSNKKMQLALASRCFRTCLRLERERLNLDKRNLRYPHVIFLYVIVNYI